MTALDPGNANFPFRHVGSLKKGRSLPFLRDVYDRTADYGRGSHSISVELVDESELLASLQATFGSPKYNPPVLPAAALEVHRLTRQRDVCIPDVCEVLEKDAFLSAGILRLAESALVSRSTPVRSVQQAAMRLGLNTLRDHVFRIAMEAKVFRTEHFKPAMESIRDHSIAVGNVARRVMEETAHSHDYAFLAGILHDVGLAAGTVVLSEWKRRGDDIDLNLAANALERCHESAAEQIATLWKLPDELRWVLGAHHSGEIQGYAHPVACGVVLAEHLVESAGGPTVVFGDTRIDHVRPRAISRAMEALQFSDATMKRLEQATAEILVT